MAFIKPGSTFTPPRPGFVVVWRDPTGAKRWKTAPTVEQAENLKAEKALLEQRSARLEPDVDPTITVSAYAEHWFTDNTPRLKPRTVTMYRDQLRLYVLPSFGPTRLRDLTRRQIRRWLARLLAAGRQRRPNRPVHSTTPKGLDKDTVRGAYAVLNVLLNSAMADELIASNPGARMGREFKLMPKPAERAARIKAMTDDQLRAFLATLHDPTHPHERRHYPLFFLLSRTGLRIGEAFALTPDDIDFVRGVVRVERAFSDGILGTPKTAESTRDVDLSPALADVLRRHLRDRATRCLAHGFTAPWLFLSETGSRLTKQNTSRAMSRLCRRAGIGHFTPHDLRHTFASLLLANGESPRYVQQQLGHKTLSMTTDLYGKWLRAKPLRGGTAALDAPTPGLQTGLHATLADHIRQ